MPTRKLLLYFLKCEIEKPIIYHLVKDYNLMINIFRARVTPEEEGYLVLDVTGTDEDIQHGLEYVKTLGVTVNETLKGVRWDSQKCTSCGNCIPRCPTGALNYPDPHTRKVDFDPTRCIECLNCIRNCPFDACHSLF